MIEPTVVQDKVTIEDNLLPQPDLLMMSGKVITVI